MVGFYFNMQGEKNYKIKKIGAEITVGTYLNC